MKKRKAIILIIIILLIVIVSFLYFYLNYSEDKKNSSKSQENEINKIDNMNETLENNYIDYNNIETENENSIDETDDDEIKNENKIENVVEKDSKNETDTNTVKDSSNDKKNESNNKEDNKTEESVFLTDFENYNIQSNEVKITENQAKQIAQIGFEESARRIAGEGADNKETERIIITEMSPNNYFTRKYNEYDMVYTNIKRKCYVITRENEMGNGISIYIDVTTGLIIGGEAFGD